MEERLRPLSHRPLEESQGDLRRKGFGEAMSRGLRGGRGCGEQCVPPKYALDSPALVFGGWAERRKGQPVADTENRARVFERRQSVPVGVQSAQVLDLGLESGAGRGIAALRDVAQGDKQGGRNARQSRDEPLPP